MIRDHQVARKGGKILLGLVVGEAVMDIETDLKLLKDCLDVLTREHRGLVYTTMGRFGSLDVTLNVLNDDTVSIFIDGPEFDTGRSQSAAIWPGKESLRKIIYDILEDGKK